MAFGKGTGPRSARRSVEHARRAAEARWDPVLARATTVDHGIFANFDDALTKAGTDPLAVRVAEQLRDLELAAIEDAVDECADPRNDDSLTLLPIFEDALLSALIERYDGWARSRSSVDNPEFFSGLDRMASEKPELSDAIGELRESLAEAFPGISRATAIKRAHELLAFPAAGGLHDLPPDRQGLLENTMKSAALNGSRDGATPASAQAQAVTQSTTPRPTSLRLVNRPIYTALADPDEFLSDPSVDEVRVGATELWRWIDDRVAHLSMQEVAQRVSPEATDTPRPLPAEIAVAAQQIVHLLLHEDPKVPKDDRLLYLDAFVCAGYSTGQAFVRAIPPPHEGSVGEAVVSLLLWGAVVGDTILHRWPYFDQVADLFIDGWLRNPNIQALITAGVIEAADSEQILRRCFYEGFRLLLVGLLVEF